MKATDPTALYSQFLKTTNDPQAAATLAGLVYQAGLQPRSRAMDGGLLDIEGVAEYTGLSSKAVRRLVDAGSLTSVEFGRAIRFTPEAVQACIDNATGGRDVAA